MKRLTFLGSVLTIFFLVPCVAIAGLSAARRKSEFEKALALIMSSVTPDFSLDDRERLVKSYLEAKPNKALAVQDVYRRYLFTDLHEDEMSAADRTLEACQMRFGKPCALIASNEEVSADEQLTFMDMPRLSYTGDFDLSKIPVIRAATRARSDVQRYFKADEPKAVAIHPWGELFISSGTRTAQRDVLARCNRFAETKGMGPCFLYAIGDKVVLTNRITKTE